MSQNGVNILKRSIKHALKIVRKSFQNRAENDPRSMRMRPWSVFGAKLRPGWLLQRRKTKFSANLVRFSTENCAPRVVFGTVGKSKIVQKSYLSCLRQYSRSGPWKASLHARALSITTDWSTSNIFSAAKPRSRHRAYIMRVWCCAGERDLKPSADP